MDSRQRMTRAWMFADYWGAGDYVDRPEEEQLDYGKALLMAANGDGRLTPTEKDWVLGYVATGGHSDEILDQLRAFDGEEDFAALFTRGPNVFVKRVCIYDAIRASGADGDLADDEIAAIRSMAARLDVTDGVVDELVGLYREEQDLKARRLKACFPMPVP
ncbi:MAG TPA: hypothetical protein VF244_09500 [Acidimicrobiales bacterium]